MGGPSAGTLLTFGCFIFIAVATPAISLVLVLITKEPIFIKKRISFQKIGMFAFGTGVLFFTISLINQVHSELEYYLVIDNSRIRTICIGILAGIIAIASQFKESRKVIFFIKPDFRRWQLGNVIGCILCYAVMISYIYSR